MLRLVSKNNGVRSIIGYRILRYPYRSITRANVIQLTGFDAPPPIVSDFTPPSVFPYNQNVDTLEGDVATILKDGAHLDELYALGNANCPQISGKIWERKLERYNERINQMAREIAYDLRPQILNDFETVPEFDSWTAAFDQLISAAVDFQRQESLSHLKTLSSPSLEVAVEDAKNIETFQNPNSAQDANAPRVNQDIDTDSLVCDEHPTYFLDQAIETSCEPDGLAFMDDILNTSHRLDFCSTGHSTTKFESPESPIDIDRRSNNMFNCDHIGEFSAIDQHGRSFLYQVRNALMHSSFSWMKEEERNIVFGLLGKIQGFDELETCARLCMCFDNGLHKHFSWIRRQRDLRNKEALKTNTKRALDFRHLLYDLDLDLNSHLVFLKHQYSPGALCLSELPAGQPINFRAIDGAIYNIPLLINNLPAFSGAVQSIDLTCGLPSLSDFLQLNKSSIFTSMSELEDFYWDIPPDDILPRLRFIKNGILLDEEDLIQQLYKSKCFEINYPASHRHLSSLGLDTFRMRHRLSHLHSGILNSGMRRSVRAGRYCSDVLSLPSPEYTEDWSDILKYGLVCLSLVENSFSRQRAHYSAMPFYSFAISIERILSSTAKPDNNFVLDASIICTGANDGNIRFNEHQSIPEHLKQVKLDGGTSDPVLIHRNVVDAFMIMLKKSQQMECSRNPFLHEQPSISEKSIMYNMKLFRRNRNYLEQWIEHQDIDPLIDVNQPQNRAQDEILRPPMHFLSDSSSILPLGGANDLSSYTELPFVRRALIQLASIEFTKFASTFGNNNSYAIDCDNMKTHSISNSDIITPLGDDLITLDKSAPLFDYGSPYELQTLPLEPEPSEFEFQETTTESVESLKEQKSCRYDPMQPSKMSSDLLDSRLINTCARILQIDTGSHSLPESLRSLDTDNLKELTMRQAILALILPYWRAMSHEERMNILQSSNVLGLDDFSENNSNKILCPQPLTNVSELMALADAILLPNTKTQIKPEFRLDMQNEASSLLNILHQRFNSDPKTFHPFVPNWYEILNNTEGVALATPMQRFSWMQKFTRMLLARERTRIEGPLPKHAGTPLDALSFDNELQKTIKRRMELLGETLTTDAAAISKIEEDPGIETKETLDAAKNKHFHLEIKEALATRVGKHLDTEKTFSDVETDASLTDGRAVLDTHLVKPIGQSEDRTSHLDLSYLSFFVDPETPNELSDTQIILLALNKTRMIPNEQIPSIIARVESGELINPLELIDMTDTEAIAKFLIELPGELRNRVTGSNVFRKIASSLSAFGLESPEGIKDTSNIISGGSVTHNASSDELQKQMRLFDSLTESYEHLFDRCLSVNNAKPGLDSNDMMSAIDDYNRASIDQKKELTKELGVVLSSSKNSAKVKNFASILMVLIYDPLVTEKNSYLQIIEDYPPSWASSLLAFDPSLKEQNKLGIHLLRNMHIKQTLNANNILKSDQLQINPILPLDLTVENDDQNQTGKQLQLLQRLDSQDILDILRMIRLRDMNSLETKFQELGFFDLSPEESEDRQRDIQDRSEYQKTSKVLCKLLQQLLADSYSSAQPWDHRELDPDGSIIIPKTLRDALPECEEIKVTLDQISKHFSDNPDIRSKLSNWRRLLSQNGWLNWTPDTRSSKLEGSGDLGDERAECMVNHHTHDLEFGLQDNQLHRPNDAYLMNDRLNFNEEDEASIQDHALSVEKEHIADTVNDKRTLENKGSTDELNDAVILSHKNIRHLLKTEKFDLLTAEYPYLQPFEDRLSKLYDALRTTRVPLPEEYVLDTKLYSMFEADAERASSHVVDHSETSNELDPNSIDADPNFLRHHVSAKFENELNSARDDLFDETKTPEESTLSDKWTPDTYIEENEIHCPNQIPEYIEQLCDDEALAKKYSPSESEAGNITAEDAKDQMKYEIWQYLNQDQRVADIHNIYPCNTLPTCPMVKPYFGIRHYPSALPSSPPKTLKDKLYVQSLKPNMFEDTGADNEETQDFIEDERDGLDCEKDDTSPSVTNPMSLPIFENVEKPLDDEDVHILSGNMGLMPDELESRSSNAEVIGDSGTDWINRMQDALGEQIHTLPYLGEDWKLVRQEEGGDLHWRQIDKFGQGAMVLQIKPAKVEFDGLVYTMERVCIIMFSRALLFLSERQLECDEPEIDLDDLTIRSTVRDEVRKADPSYQDERLLFEHDQKQLSDQNPEDSAFSIIPNSVYDYMLDTDTEGSIPKGSPFAKDNKKTYPIVRQRIFSIPPNILTSLKMVHWPETQDIRVRASRFPDVDSAGLKPGSSEYKGLLDADIAMVEGLPQVHLQILEKRMKTMEGRVAELCKSDQYDTVPTYHLHMEDTI